MKTTEEENLEAEEENKESFLGLLLICIAVLGVWLGISFLEFTLINEWAARGQFGDMFGSVNSLFSGLAFAVLIYTIYLQRKELRLQRIELRLQRSEMSKSTQALNKQVSVEIAKLRATALTFKVEGIKIASLSKIPGARAPYVVKIDEAAQLADDLAADLKDQNKKDDSPH